MESEKHSPEQKATPKIETVRMPNGDEASFSTERGGIVTSIRLLGKELLYLDKDTFNDQTQNVKGGIPILFPNAGPIVHENFPGLKQHGFARNSLLWRTTGIETDGFSETLQSDSQSQAMYPHDFELTLHGKFSENGSFKLTQKVINLDAEKDLPVSMGLHPYFNVANEMKGKIVFDFPGGDKIMADVEKWANGNSVSIDNPNQEMRIVIPSLGVLFVTFSSEYKKVVVWSMPDKDFICIEPFMRPSGGLVDDPEVVGPKKTFSATLDIRLEQ